MSILDRIKNEPALIGVLVTSIVGLLTAYHIDVSADQKTAIVTVVAAIVGLFVRANVSATATPDQTPAQVAKVLANAEAIKAAVNPQPAPAPLTAIGGVVEVEAAP